METPPELVFPAEKRNVAAIGLALLWLVAAIATLAGIWLWIVYVRPALRPKPTPESAAVHPEFDENK